MKKVTSILIGSLASLILLAGCSAPAQEMEDGESQAAVIENQEQLGKDITTEEPSVDGTEAEDASIDDNKVDEQTVTEPTLEERMAAIDLSVKPNESGKVMILMYHNIGDEEKTWVRTPDNFRRDLETLYAKGYRPVSLVDYVRGSFDIPAGTTPFVLTFDDGNENNFRYLETDLGWEIDPECAVGILESFRKEHEDFNPQATFFVYGSRPFRQEELVEKKLEFLVNNDYGVGNHSWGHDDYKEEKYTDPQMVMASLGKNVAFLETFLEAGAVNTLALPYGHRPKDDTAEVALFDGSYEGTEYENVAVLNVGWDPDKSPYHMDFDPTSIHRVRASETNVDNVGLYDWLAYFDKHPSQRYISDGDLEIVTVPESKADSLSEAYMVGGELADHKFVYVIE
jgi:hypothetical protein